jgi:hypothetical protein
MKLVVNVAKEFMLFDCGRASLFCGFINLGDYGVVVDGKSGRNNKSAAMAITSVPASCSGVVEGSR